jgi:Tol biopolymer transport system component
MAPQGQRGSPCRLLLVSLTLPLAFLNASCSLNAPNIVAIAPGRDARDVPTNQEIRIAFDRSMDHRSVESRFELRPPLQGCVAPACQLVWRQNALVFIHPHLNLQFDTRYVVLLHSGYGDSNGNQNSLEHSWAFTTEGRPTLSAVDPPDGATGVAPDRNIVLTFNRPMDSASLASAISISPEIPFLIRARPGGDGSQVEVVPTELLRPGGAYSVAVDAALDTHGNTVVGRLESRFTVGAVSEARRIAFLIAAPAKAPFGIAAVDPHPDTFLNQSTAKILYQLQDGQRATSGIIGFDWAPDGTRLVLATAPTGALEGPLSIVDLKAGSATPLNVSGSSVAWSPDGSTIAYLTHGVLHGFRVATSEDTVLTQGQPVIPPLAFAPDGKAIAYAAQDAEGLPRLQILNLQLHSSFRPIGLEDPADHPVWSFDGTRLAFRRITAHGPQLWVYDLSGSGATTYRQEASLDIQSATWLNDNSTLVVTVGTGAQSALYRVNVFAPTEAGGLVKLTGGQGAPDGMAPSAPTYDRRIAFTAMVDGLPQLFVMNGDGSRPVQLTRWDPDFPYTADGANWNPTG